MDDKREQGLRQKFDVGSPTWRYVKYMIEKDISDSRDRLEAPGIDERQADELRGRIRLGNQLLGLGGEG